MSDVSTSSDLSTQNGNISHVTLHKFVIDSLPCAVVTVDSDLKIIGFNPCAEKLTGYPSKDAIGRHCGDILQGGMCNQTFPLKGSVEGGSPFVQIDTTI